MSPHRIKANLHRQDDCMLGESPFWYEDHLWWVDIERGLLLSADGHGNLMENFAFGQRIGAATPAGDGTFLVALEREIVRLDLDSKHCETVARPGDLPQGSRFNDGKCDPMGRWVIGTTSHGNPKTSSLYSLRKDHSLHRLRGGISISNGLVWSADGKTMYYIDTMALCVSAYDYDMENGGLSGERIIIHFAAKEGWPDGMAIDRDGRLWIAFWDGSEVRCYRPETGLCERIIQLPCSRPTSCCFGGVDMNRLFITTARLGLSGTELLRQPLAGSLFLCDPETTGLPSPLFNYDRAK